MVLLCSSLSSFRSPSYGGLTTMLWSSLTDTYNNSSWTICFSVWIPIDTLSRSLDIGYSTTSVWCKTQLYRACLKHLFIFVCIFRLWILYHRASLFLFNLRFILSDPNLLTVVFCLKSNRGKNWPRKFFSLGLFIVPNMPKSIGFLLTRPSGV